MDKISDYEIIEEVSASNNTLIYKAKDSTGLPYILKVLREDSATADKIAQFKREYDITLTVQSSYTTEAVEIIRFNNTLAIVQKDISGETLGNYIKSLGKINSNEKIEIFLKIAILISKALGDIHDHNIVHKDINPSNIIFNPKSNELKVIDFGLASDLILEKIENNTNFIEGTLAYISPEQTGRLNRGIDYRSDYYSFGILLYEFLTGEQPFQGENAREWVHCHLAKTPENIELKNLKIPTPIREIVFKLLEKAPENRYQSSYGITKDLEICLQELILTDKIKPFDIGKSDISKRFRLPQKLYARENELALLIHAVEKTSTKESQFFILKGHSGIGKTSLVNELKSHVLDFNGWLISGKYDMYNSKIPYYGITQSFTQLINNILSESDEEVEKWKEKILDAIKTNTQLLTSLIPNLSLITGKQPLPLELPKNEAHNRFLDTFIKLLSIFANKEHPLIIFLDDLQWVDTATLDILIHMASNRFLTGYMVILSYRDNEITPGHPFMEFLTELKKLKKDITEIKLQPLSIFHIEPIISDSISAHMDDIKKLSEIAFNKTYGNPLYLIEFLSTLFPLNLISFNNKEGKWDFKFQEIENLDITINVADIISNRISALDEKTQEIIKLASVIGTQFSTHLLAFLSGFERTQLFNILNSAIDERLITPISGDFRYAKFSETEITTFKFSHDKIRQTLYSEIDDVAKKEIHHKLGNHLYQLNKDNHTTELLFVILGHLNLCIDLLNETEKEEVCKLNHDACKSAMSSGAYNIAFQYIKQSITLLIENKKVSEKPNTFQIYLDAGEAAALCGEYKSMDNLLHGARSIAKNNYQKIRIQYVELKALIAQNHQQEAIIKALNLLNTIDIKIPKNANLLHVLAELLSTRNALKKKPLVEDENLPIMEDQSYIIATEVMGSLISFLYRVNPNLLAIFVFKMVKLTLNYGVAPISPVGIVTYAFLINVLFKKTDKSIFLSSQGMKMFDVLTNKSHWAQASYLLTVGIKHWHEPFENVIPEFEKCYYKAQELGDHETMQSAAVGWANYAFRAGYELNEVMEKTMKFVFSLTKYHQKIAFTQLEVLTQTIKNLKEFKSEPDVLKSTLYDEDEMFSYHLKDNDKTSLFILWANKLTLSVHFERSENMLALAEKARKYLSSANGINMYPIFLTYESVAIQHTYANAGNLKKIQGLKRIQKNRKELKHFATYSPENYGANYHFVEALYYQLKNNLKKAFQGYNKSIELASTNHIIHLEALIRLSYGHYWIELNNNEQAIQNITKAYKLNEIWGADAICSYLSGKYQNYISYLESRNDQGSRTDGSEKNRSVSETTTSIDLSTVLEASKAISREIILPKLIEKTLKIIMEHAGAEKGLLLLKNFTTNNFDLEATGEIKKNEIQITLCHDMSWDNLLPPTVLKYVERSNKALILENACKEGEFTSDKYINDFLIRSVICLPILQKNQIIGILYLENNLSSGVFNQERVNILTILCTQIAVSLENARLFNTLEQKVQDRTFEISEKNKELEHQKEELEKTGDKLKELNATKDRFFSIIAHDLKGPLGTSKAILEYYAEEIDNISSEDFHTIIEQIKLSTDQTFNLLENLLIWARTQRNEIKFNPKLNNLEETLNDCIKLLNYNLDAKNVSIFSNITTNTEFYFDYDMVATILRNIIGNAIKFVNMGGLITIDIESETKHFTIKISDNGIGMSRETVKNLFKIEQKGESQPGTSGEKGSGLGLILCNEFVKLHKGEIWAESTLKNGSKIIFTLPKNAYPE